jgi:FixJ family two-component response regulator
MANTAAIPIIFITASKEPGLRETASERYGAAGFLEKPFEASDLISMIHEALDDSTGVSSQVFMESTDR